MRTCTNFDITEVFMRSIAEYLIQDWGYINIQIPADYIWFYKNNDMVICQLDLSTDIPVTQEQLAALLSHIPGSHLLFIVHTANPACLEELLPPDSVFWCIHPDTLKLMVFERQDSAFNELEKDLEKFLERGCPRVTRRNFFYFPLATISLALICCVVFLVQLHQCNAFVYPSLTADFAAAHGGMNWRYILWDHEYWRLISSMFMHFSLGHLSGNMFSLCVLGTYVERTLGKKFFLLIYFASGIIASLVSMVYNMNEDSFVVGAGASGAIFGITGALLVCTIWRRRHGYNLDVRRVALLCLLSLALSSTADNVDNAAHIGGILAGMLFAWLCIFVRDYFDAHRRTSVG